MEPKSWFRATSLLTARSQLLHYTVIKQGEWLITMINWKYNITDNYSYANAFDNDLGIGSNTAPVGTLTPSSMPYTYSLLGSANVRSAVVGVAGATLSI